ncbi:MAG: WG repeat-containing protein [Bacteroidetes bacterium]|nr:MAG: WG repeat-containing protein [Bacteroidota bacterium]
MRVFVFFFCIYLACTEAVAQGKLIIAESFEKKGLLNRATLDVVVPYLYDAIAEGNDGSFLAYQTPDQTGNSLYVYYDAQGKEFLRYNNRNLYAPFHDGVAVFGNIDKDANPADETMTYKYGLINKKGQVILSPTYLEILNFREGIGIATKETQKFLLNTEGKAVVSLDTTYSIVSPFSEGRAFAIAEQFGLAYPPVPYDFAHGYMSHLGKLVMIDKQGKAIADFSQNEKILTAQSFRQGLAVVGKPRIDYDGFENQETVFGVVDRAGKFVLPLEYTHIDIEPAGTILATRATGEVVLYDKTGKSILNGGETKPYYTISPLFGGRFRFVRENSQEKGWGVMDMSNNLTMVVPMEYEEVYFRAPTDFWAVPKWDFLKAEIDNPDGSWETAHYAKEGKVHFYTYTRVVKSDKVFRIYDRYQTTIFDTEGNHSLVAFQLDNKWGVIDQFSIKASGYDGIEPFAWTMPNDLIGVQKRDKWGYINTAGEEVITPQYEAVTPFEQGATTVRKNNKWGLIGKNNKPLTAFEFDTITTLAYSFDATRLDRKTPNKQTYNARKNGFWGILNAQGKTIIPFEYTKIEAQDNYFIGTNKAGKVGISDHTGKVLIPYQYDEWVQKFDNYTYNPIFCLRQNAKVGLLNLKNEILIPFEYQDIKPAQGQADTWLVKQNGKTGIYKNGKIALPTQYDKIEFIGAYIKVWQAGKLGLLTQDFRQVLPCEYEDIGNYYAFTREYYEPIGFKQNGLTGLFGRDWKVIVPPLYESIDVYADNTAVVKKAGKYGLITTENKVILPFEYDEIVYCFNETAYLRLTKNGKEGIGSMKGELTIPLVYDEVGHFTLATGAPMGVKQKGKWGFINEKRKMVVPAVYEDAKLFEKIGGKSLAIVRKNGKWGVIDTKNKVIVPFQYDEMRWQEFEKGELYVQVGEQGKYIDLQNKEVKK